MLGLIGEYMYVLSLKTPFLLYRSGLFKTQEKSFRLFLLPLVQQWLITQLHHLLARNYLIQTIYLGAICLPFQTIHLDTLLDLHVLQLQLAEEVADSGTV